MKEKKKEKRKTIIEVSTIKSHRLREKKKKRKNRLKDQQKEKNQIKKLLKPE